MWEKRQDEPMEKNSMSVSDENVLGSVLVVCVERGSPVRLYRFERFDVTLEIDEVCSNEDLGIALRTMLMLEEKTR
jgi:hypothetical protein